MQIIETTDNRLYRVVEPFDRGTHLDCVEVKRVKGGFADKAKGRRRLVQPAHVLRTVQ